MRPDALKFGAHFLLYEGAPSEAGTFANSRNVCRGGTAILATDSYSTYGYKPFQAMSGKGHGLHTAENVSLRPLVLMHV